MDEAPNGGGELSGPAGGDADVPADDPVPGALEPVPDPPAGPAGSAGMEADPIARALAEEAAEIRRMVEAGAGSPEAIRELAERLREHRAREEALWRAEVKPTLVKQGRGRLRRSDGSSRQAEPARSSQALWLGLGLLALVAVVVVAASTTVWLLLLPVLALLVWAWAQGRDGPAR
ncbi:MAG TPA: hypothetical protein VFV32_04590 [Acidimicrobiales bacterium]|nr:hypothetical protein [Acidimicrobiales bacterium]